MAQVYEGYSQLIDTTLTSKYLGFDKDITVTVPFEWQADVDRDFPLIIIFDRQNPRSHGYIINTIDYLTSNGQMPASIIISVASDEEHRLAETLHKVSSEDGLAKENEDFIFDELIPLAENKYNASKFRVLIGHSRYGYFTSSLLFSRINEINAIVSLSPFYTQKNVDLTDSILKLENKQLNTRKYYRFGTGGDFPDGFHKMDSSLQLIKNPNFNAKGTLFKEAGHNVTPGLTIGSALYEIFEDWSELQNIYFANEQLEVGIIDSLSKEIIASYGSELVFSLGVLNGKGWFFYGEKKYEKAILAWELLLKHYPNFSEGYLYIIEAKIQLKQDILMTVNQFEKSIHESEIFSVEEKEELKKELETLME